MLIDGFTVVAQIINFLILILLLRRFLYQPILRAMNERQAKIAAQTAEAETLKQQALAEAETYRQQQAELQSQREVLLQEAKEAAEAWRKEHLSKARQEINEARASWHKGIETERQAFIQEMRRGIGKQVYNISRRVLADLADAELERQVLQVFLRRLRELEAHQQHTLIEAITKSHSPVILRSAFAIAAPDRQKVRELVRQHTASEVDFHFEVKADLVCGIELIIEDYKLAWSLDEYLVALEERFFETLGASTEQVYAD
jgi:F-type H+-transporting ATPase subunit b